MIYTVWSISSKRERERDKGGGGELCVHVQIQRMYNVWKKYECINVTVVYYNLICLSLTWNID